jgi:hypothetical protein
MVAALLMAVCGLSMVTSCAAPPNPAPARGAHLNVTFTAIELFDSSGHMKRSEKFSSSTASVLKFARSLFGPQSSSRVTGSGASATRHYFWSGLELDSFPNTGNSIYVSGRTVNSLAIFAFGKYRSGDAFSSRDAVGRCGSDDSSHVIKLHAAAGAAEVVIDEDSNHSGVIGGFGAPIQLQGC